MRKILAIAILITAISTMSVFGSDADSIDVSSMSEFDLAMLIGKIQSELTMRSASPSDMIYEGFYEVGVDIASGLYLFYGAEKDDGNCLVTIYMSKQDYNDKTQGYVLELRGTPYGEPMSINLENGQYIRLGNDFVITKPAQSFWTPQ